MVKWKKPKMKERDFQTEFAKRNTLIGAFELKFCKGTSLPFSALAPHQEQALLDFSSSKGLYHKLTDSPFFKDPSGKMRFTRPKPFDCFNIARTSAYVVVMFWVSRKRKMVYYIHIDWWIEMREKANRKSVTEVMAVEYAEVIQDYKKK